MCIRCNNSIINLKNLYLKDNCKENKINFYNTPFFGKINEHKNLDINENSLLGVDDNNIDEDNLLSSNQDFKVVDFPENFNVELTFPQLFLSKSTKPIEVDTKDQKINNINNSTQNIKTINNISSNEQGLDNLNNTNLDSIKLNNINKDLNNNVNKIKNKGKNFLNKKRRMDIFIPLKIPKNSNLNSKIISRDILICQDKKLKYPGKKREKNFDKRRHDKWDNSNMINKIKRGFFTYIRDIIKKNAINKDIDIKKIGNNFMENLTKKSNIILYNMKLKEVLSDVEISNKYKKFDKDYNKITINNIYNEKTEINIIKILNLTFEELFIIFRKKLNFYKDKEKYKDIEAKINGLDLLQNNSYKDIEHLLNNIQRKYKNLQSNEVEKYIIKIKILCCRYQQWFNNKAERNPKKNN